jgi:hypothetical protein
MHALECEQQVLNLLRHTEAGCGCDRSGGVKGQKGKKIKSVRKGGGKRRGGAKRKGQHRK